jgi:excisionase family DNA binding protein
MKELAHQMLNETIMLYSVNDAGKLLSLSPSTIRRYIFKRKIASVKIGRRVLIPYETLAKLVREGYRPEKPKGKQQRKDQPLSLQRSFFA